MEEPLRRAGRSQRAPQSLVALLFLAILPADQRVSAADATLPPRALSQGRRPDDRRLVSPRYTGSTIPFVPSATLSQWEARAERLRRQGLVGLGLWPMPQPTPLQAVVHGQVQRDGYSVCKVYFESYPGHFVTGNLYCPDGAGRHPAVLCPYGHWPGGRCFELTPAQLKEQIAKGQERYEQGGRYPLQARCATLARLGCVVFQWDLEGYCDSIQLPHTPLPRPHMNTRIDWGLVSPQAELRLQTLSGIQIYNAMRAVDFVAALPEVDPGRIAVTGASGGGMQTTLLCAFDGRPAAAVPVVWVSTTLHGGCTCNMAPYLRVDEGNVGLAALIAPRPLLLIGANDWTLHIDTQGYPELRQHYGLFGAADRVAVQVFPQYPHNYNYGSRAAMYQFLNRHLRLGHPEPIVEPDFVPLSRQELHVWDAAHPKPSGSAVGESHERALLRWINAQSDRQMDRLIPEDAEGLPKFREVVGGAADILLGGPLPDASQLIFKSTATRQRSGHREEVGLLTHGGTGQQLPLLLLEPIGVSGPTVLWLLPEGKTGLYASSGAIRPAVRRLLDAGLTVAGVDLLYQGEFLADGRPLQKAPPGLDRAGKPAVHPDYTFSFNLSLFSQRVRDVLAAIQFLRHHSPASDAPLHLLAGAGAGHWAAAARALADGAVAKAALHTAAFRFAHVDSFDHPDFLPGGAKYHDLPGMLALGAPRPLWLAGEGPRPPRVVIATYQAAGASDELTLFAGSDAENEAAAIDWLLTTNE